MSTFRTAVSAAFRRADGAWNFPGFDLDRLTRDPAFDVVQLANDSVLEPADLAGFDALLLAGESLKASSLPPDGRLAVVARFGVGYDKVDVDACTRAAVALTITPEAVRRPVAVAAVTLVLALAGRLLTKDRLTREGPAGFARRTDHMGVGLVGRTLASLGIGNIGAEMFRLMRPFGMRHIAHDPYADAKTARELGVMLVDLDTAFREADFLAINCPFTPQTRRMVDAARLATMKRTAFVVNTARGQIVDQPALEEALLAGTIAGAGLDVLDPEPAPAGSRILGLDNVILAPHALSWTDQGFAAIGGACLDAIAMVARGDPPPHVVNATVLEQPAFRDKLRRRAGPPRDA